MKILSKLTNKYLKQNKKRTIVTIIGIILSGAMITAVSTLAVSFQGFMIKVEKDATGSWEAIFEKVPYSQIKYIENNDKFEESMLKTDLGMADNQFSDEPYLDVRAYDQESLDSMAIGVEEGRLPENSKEIILSSTFYDGKGGEPQIGDTLMLSLDGEEKTYTICGTMSKPSFESYESEFVGAITKLEDGMLSENSLVDVGVVTKNPKTIYEDCQEIADNLNQSSNEGSQEVTIKYNNNVLAYMGVNQDDGFEAMIYSVCGILIFIIAVGSILVIYNAFAISVSERKKQFGMLSSVGATKKQLKKSVTHEAFVLGAIGIPLGILSGIGGIWITLQVVNYLLSGMQSVLNTSMSIDFMVSWQSILISAILIAITIYISAYIPARRASKITPIEAIRQNDDIKIKAKKVKTPKWIRKVFGEEGEIALKNLKRSKKRYRTTVISLIISVVLFISVNGFVNYMFKAFDAMYKTVDYDYVAAYTEKQDGRSNLEEVGEELTKTEGIERSIVYHGTFGRSSIPKEKLGKECLELLGSESYKEYFAEVNGSYDLTVQLFSCNDQEMQKYLNSLGIDPLRENEVIVVDYTNMLGTAQIEMNITSYKEGDKIKIDFSGDGEEESTREFTIRKVVDHMPYAVENQDISLYMITSEDTVESLKEAGVVKASNIQYQFIAKTENVEALAQRVDEIQKEDQNLEIIGQNIKETYQANKNLFFIISIFLYGFIALISLIGIANIFNTIATNISLRRREFANLKSIGMTDKQFKRMLDLECVFYGTKALLFGIPIGIICCYLLNMAFGNMITFNFNLPWSSIIIAIVAVYIIVFITMMYASKKVKKENIIDVLRDDNV